MPPASDTWENLLTISQPRLRKSQIMLPGEINGIELLETLKKDEILKKIPVIVLTNLDSERNRAMKIGATDYLLKVDTDVEELVKKVGKNIA